MLEARKQSGFLDEARHARPGRSRRDSAQGGDRLLRPAHGIRRGEMLLDRHVPVHLLIEGQVDDAEAALAQHAGDFRIRGPGARGQRLADCLVRSARGRSDCSSARFLIVVLPVLAHRRSDEGGRSNAAARGAKRED
jgi:hypothetical protein